MEYPIASIIAIVSSRDEREGLDLQGRLVKKETKDEMDLTVLVDVQVKKGSLVLKGLTGLLGLRDHQVLQGLVLRLFFIEDVKKIVVLDKYAFLTLGRSRNYGSTRTSWPTRVSGSTWSVRSARFRRIARRKGITRS